MIIGLTGTNGAGKTVTAEHLRTKGFEYHSLSDEIRVELNSVGREATRENLIEMGNQLRGEYGPAVLADRIKSRLRTDRNYVIDSIRNPYEVKSFRADKGFHLLAVLCGYSLLNHRMILKVVNRKIILPFHRYTQQCPVPLDGKFLDGFIRETDGTGNDISGFILIQQHDGKLPDIDTLGNGFQGKIYYRIEIFTGVDQPGNLIEGGNILQAGFGLNG